MSNIILEMGQTTIPKNKQKSPNSNYRKALYIFLIKTINIIWVIRLEAIIISSEHFYRLDFAP